jgi:transcriptional regulator with AbiEi antitoxin domain of type IV toxin-antitoxin system
MITQKGGKLNQLERLLPEGLLVDAAWLERQGYSRALRHQYVSSGWLEQPVRGVYHRHRTISSWEQIVISLQTLLQYPVSVGGRSALELQGYAHYLPASPDMRTIHLYTDKKLPGWLTKFSANAEFISHNRSRFLSTAEQNEEALVLDNARTNTSTTPLSGGLQILPWGQWNWPLVISSPERAILELMDELPRNESFHQVDMIMESLVNLRPRRLQALLEDAKSIKVKRLFFFFADRHRHKWLSHLDRKKISLGSGKRVIFQGGILDSKYKITVPEEFNAIH